jgi:hypothetical protein
LLVDNDVASMIREETRAIKIKLKACNVLTVIKGELIIKTLCMKFQIKKMGIFFSAEEHDVQFFMQFIFLALMHS